MVKTVTKLTALCSIHLVAHLIACVLLFRPLSAYAERADLANALLSGRFNVVDAIVKETQITYDGSLRARGIAGTIHTVQELVERVQKEVHNVTVHMMSVEALQDGRVAFEIRVYHTEKGKSFANGSLVLKPTHYKISLVDLSSPTRIAQNLIGNLSSKVGEKLKRLPHIQIFAAQKNSDIWKISLKPTPQPWGEAHSVLVTITIQNERSRYYLGSFIVSGQDAEELSQRIAERLKRSYLSPSNLRKDKPTKYR